LTSVRLGAPAREQRRGLAERSALELARGDCPDRGRRVGWRGLRRCGRLEWRGQWGGGRGCFRRGRRGPDCRGRRL